MNQTGLWSMVAKPLGQRSKKRGEVILMQRPGLSQAQLRLQTQLNKGLTPVITPAGRLGAETDEAVMVPTKP